MLTAVIDASRFNPVPPVHAQVGNETHEWIFLIVASVAAIAGLVAAVVIGRRMRSWVPILCMVGGFLTLFQEPLIDQHLQVWWNDGELPTVFEAFGRAIPVFLIPALLVFYGVGVMLRWYFLVRYGKRFPIWTVFALETLLAWAIEPVAIQLGLWQYYGYQGIRVLGYPVWWPVVGGTCGVVAGTLIYRLEPHLKGWRIAAVPAIMCAGIAAVYWGVSWPMFNLLNEESPHGLILAGTVLTTAQCIFVVWICSIATGYHAHRQQLKREAAATSSSPLRDQALDDAPVEGVAVPGVRV